MEEHIVKILKIQLVNYNVKRFIVEKPKNYKFIPGQATEVSINKPKWRNTKGPFTFTSLNEDPHLEFIIKIYPERKNLTNELNKLKRGDELIIRNVWGAIKYRGPGIFIAGGAGITPFLSILRQLNKENKIAGNTLIFSNKTEKDIILKDELESMLKSQCIFVLTKQKHHLYENTRIDKEYLKRNIHNFNQNFYVCGPKQMVMDINEALKSLCANPDSLVFEK
ncbi:MAG: FAD-binding oxidoreductase [Candidatus Pacearchaeota archaeon]